MITASNPEYDRVPIMHRTEGIVEPEQVADSTGPATILVVEDDQDTAQFLRELLAEAGHSVLTAGNGNEAIRLFKSDQPDLVLMDLMLPGMDGYAVTQRIRAMAPGKIPIIMLTAAGQPSSKLRGFDAGVDDFVVKPFSSPELLARIAIQLRWNQAVRRLEDQGTVLQQTLELVTRQQRETETNLEIERSMRTDLLRSVNTHLKSLCSVFEVEYRRQPPGPGREALQRVIPRLHGAALVYQISEALTGEMADFGEVLRTIASALKNVYSPRKRIPVRVEAGPVEIPSAIASPLAMIANELVTNAFKHAFPHSRFGAIDISSRIEAGQLYLEVVDDGVGLEPSAGTSSRGLPTVRQLVAELGGTFDLDTSPSGTRAALRVPLPPEAHQAPDERQPT